MTFEVLGQVLITYPRNRLVLTVWLFLIVYCVCNVLHLNSTLSSLKMTRFTCRALSAPSREQYWPRLIHASLPAAIVHRRIVTAVHHTFPLQKSYA